MPSLSDIPVEVLLDNLLPILSVPDILHLASTNRSFSRLCEDDTLWKRRCEADFNFTGSETARKNGWRILYRGLSHPRVFVWGDRSNGRLGLASYPKLRARGIPYPAEIRIPGARIISLTAGGMSFHALDSEGFMYVWGALDGQNMALNSEGFSISHKVAPVPHRLVLPNPIRSVSCGRLHTMVLDAKSQIWTFLSWGRPFRFQSHLLDCLIPDTTPVQIESGWAFSSVLTKSGDVLVYWPYSGSLGLVLETNEAELNAQGDKHAYPTSDHTVPCVLSDILADPFRLPAIPVLDLPELSGTSLTEEQLKEETKLIRIAAYDNNLVGLTNKGHVLKYSLLGNETEYRQAHWEYLPNFSEVARVQQHSTFAGEGATVEAPQAMLITHVSAHFQTFVAYSTGSSSVILMGDTHTSATSEPKVIPALQHRSIISVILGDYHFGALTSTGQLLTWGAFSNGALGLGDPLTLPHGSPGGYSSEAQKELARSQRWGLPNPEDVQEPAEVDFNNGKPGGKKFCFAATAAGWHTGAIVIDLEPDVAQTEGQAEQDDRTQRMPGQFPSEPSHYDIPQDPSGLPLLPGRTMGTAFRIGYAGRGIRGMPMRGHLGPNGRGRGWFGNPPPT